MARKTDAPVAMEYDELQYQAESLVRDKLYSSPEFKAEVKRVKAELAKVKKSVRPLAKKGK